MSQSWNWILLILGVLAFAAEVALGVSTGFDLALLGASLAAGGALGLLFHSPRVGVFSSGIFAFIYYAFFRRRIRAKLSHGHVPTNADAVLGRTGVVTERLAPHVAGMVRVGDELWRARLVKDTEGEPSREPGTTVTVESVDGVTLRVN